MIATVVAYIKLVEAAQFPDVIMGEVECLHELEFRYKDSLEPMQAAKTLATNLKVRCIPPPKGSTADAAVVVRAGRCHLWRLPHLRERQRHGEQLCTTPPSREHAVSASGLPRMSGRLLTVSGSTKFRKSLYLLQI